MTDLSGTVIALDVGERRIGVAMANLKSRLPQAWGVIERSKDTLATINTMLIEHHVVAIVVGLPRGLEGQETAQTKLVRAFTDDLKNNIQLPLYYQDEALTSKQAEEELRQRKVEYNKGAVDALAATYMLSDFLGEHQEL